MVVRELFSGLGLNTGEEETERANKAKKRVRRCLRSKCKTIGPLAKVAWLIMTLLTIRGILIIAYHGLDRAANYGNIAAAASRVETHGAHHCRHRPAHHHLKFTKFSVLHRFYFRNYIDRKSINKRLLSLIETGWQRWFPTKFKWKESWRMLIFFRNSFI